MQWWHVTMLCHISKISNQTIPLKGRIEEIEFQEDNRLSRVPPRGETKENLHVGEQMQKYFHIKEGFENNYIEENTHIIHWQRILMKGRRKSGKLWKILCRLIAILYLSTFKLFFYLKEYKNFSATWSAQAQCTGGSVTIMTSCNAVQSISPNSVVAESADKYLYYALFRDHFIFTPKISAIKIGNPTGCSHIFARSHGGKLKF